MSHNDIFYVITTLNSTRDITSLQENQIPPCLTHRITESFRLERTFKIVEFIHKPNTPKSTTKPCP